MVADRRGRVRAAACAITVKDASGKVPAPAPMEAGCGQIGSAGDRHAIRQIATVRGLG